MREGQARWLAVVVLTLALGTALTAQERPASRPNEPLPGRTFQSEATRQLEADDAANPGLLWLEQGEALWTKAEGPADRSCASCHQDAARTMPGVAGRYPQIDTTAEPGAADRLINLEQRIQQCRTERQGGAPLAWESNDLLALTAYVTRRSKGLPKTVSIDGAAQPFFEQGHAFYMTRQGQLNLACANCHEDNIGRHLRGDTISQGHTDGWPAYRLDWQTVGSLHRRLRACSLGVRATVLDYGAPEYVALELYLAWRGQGCPCHPPASGDRASTAIIGVD